MGLYTTKPVFGVYVRLKSGSSATETSQKFAILPVASLDMILNKKLITKVLISQPGCAGWSAPLLLANPQKQVFSHRGPYFFLHFSVMLFLGLARLKFRIHFVKVLLESMSESFQSYS